MVKALEKLRKWFKNDKIVQHKKKQPIESISTIRSFFLVVNSLKKNTSKHKKIGHCNENNTSQI